MHRPGPGRPSAHAILERPLAVYVVAAEGEAAGIVIHALEREGLNVNAAWGPLPKLAEAESELDIVIVVETDGSPYPEDDYRRLRDALPDAKIAVISSAHRERPQALLWAGVDALVFEPGADSVVGPATRALLGGCLVVPIALRAAIHPPPLTRRERQMLQLLVEGLTNREIAERLYLAESTVKRHLSATFRRLGVSSRREAAAVVLAAESSFGVSPSGPAEPPPDVSRTPS